MPKTVRYSVIFNVLEKPLLPLITLLGAFLQFYRINSYSLGFDESYSVYLTHFKVSKLLTFVSNDTHPPLFYLILKLWTHFFGDGVIAVRSLSAVLMIISIPIAYLLVKELFGKKAGYLAALLFALGPFIVRYGHEARMYALMTCLILLATYILTITIRKRISNWFGFSVYALVMSAAVYTHYYAFLMLPSHWILVMILKGQSLSPGNCWKNLRNKGWLFSQIAILILYIPWLPYALVQINKVEGAFWLPPVQLKTIPSTFLDFTTYQSSSGFSYSLTLIFTALLLIIFVLTYALISRRLIDKKLVLFFVSVMFFGPILIFILSIGRSVYYDRYFIYVATFYYLFLGVIFSRQYKGLFKFLQLGGIIAVLALFLVGIIRVDQPQYDNVSLLMRNIDKKSSSHNYHVLVIDHTLYYQVEYYSHSTEPTQITQSASLGGYGDMFAMRSNPTLIAHNYNYNGNVWVVFRGPGSIRNVPSSWKLVDKTDAYFGVEAQEYKVK